MHYWIAFVLENNTRWYLSKVDPSTNRHFKDQSALVANFGSEQAHQFKTKEEAMDAVALFCEDKPGFRLAGLAEVNYYPLVSNGTQNEKQKST